MFQHSAPIFSITHKTVLSAALGALLLFACAITVRAQYETGTISGTAADTSGAALVGATVKATNTGTNVSQSSVTDADGRYRLADLPIGTYSVQASQSGFQTVVHTNITLTVGANLVVDFSLPVGQVTQTVNVESQVSRVETQTAAVSSLVTPQQMSQLPLNGRNFEQLLSLAPGVQSVTQSYITGGGGGGISSGFYGPGQTYSVAGSRPEGQLFLLDDQDMQGYWNKGVGSNITGNSLGVEAIAEFQVLTNTYSAQYGGTGAAINAASKSGTNDYHGSLYEYVRNSALDARNFFDGPQIPAFTRNQYGGSLGGPVKKNKLFFFVNYEGVKSNLGITGNQFVPDRDALGMGTRCAGEVAYQEVCVPVNGAPTLTAVKPVMAPYLQMYPVPGVNAPEQRVAAGPLQGTLSGNQLVTTIANQPENENYVLGRMDYTIGANDSIFGRYISDTAYFRLPVPFSNLPLWPVVDHGGDQFFTIEEKHILSPTAINAIRFSFSRTNERADQEFTSNPATDLLQFYNGAPTYTPGQREDGNIIIAGGTSNVGPGATARFHLIENKFTGGDDFSWTHGAHTVSVGLWVTRIEDNIAVGREGGIFVFPSLAGFMADLPVQFQGEANPSPTFDRTRYSRSIAISPYIQDDWKVRSNLTLNLGLRYDYETNPVCVAVQCTNLLNPLTSSVFTPVSHVLASNPDVLNLDPRIGLAWAPFNNQNTSIRAGFGVFHEPLAARTFLNAYSENPPSNTVVMPGVPVAGLDIVTPMFPNPALSGFALPYGAVYGLDYRSDSSPYEIQYNLTIQQNVGGGMVASIGYVGAQGVHLYSQRNYNTPTPTMNYTTTPAPLNCTSPSCTFTGPAPNPAFVFTPPLPFPQVPTTLGLDFTAPTSHSTYNGLIASLTRQISKDLQGQVSYTYSRCIDDGSASSGLEQGSFELTDVYNPAFDRGTCTFNVTNALRVNSVYSLPFRGNRLVSGWQVSEILSAASGFPVNILTGLTPTQSNTLGLTGDRPNYSGAAGCNPSEIVDTKNFAQRYVQWFNPACYAIEPYGTLGDVGRDSLNGPGLLDLDFSIIKDTRLTERLNAEFRAEFFNIINRTNLGQPNAAIFAGTRGSPAAPLGTAFTSATAGIITSTATTSRQIQFAVKLTF